MNPKSLEWRLARLQYIRSVKDELPMEFHEDIERAERAMLRLGARWLGRAPRMPILLSQRARSTVRAASGSLPQIGDTKAIFYTVDADHTQTHSAGCMGDCLGPPQASFPTPT
jgi:hypothetical protein